MSTWPHSCVIPGRDPESRKIKKAQRKSFGLLFLDSGSEAGMTEVGPR